MRYKAIKIADIENKIKRINREPKAFQSLWNSDWEYIGLSIDLIYENERGFYKQEIVEYELYKEFKSDEELVEHVKKIGNHLSQKYQVEFYFPSPDEWSRDCPNWWKVSSSIRCEDCNTPIIPTDSQFSPKEICYPCHLIRKHSEQIISKKPHDDGINMFLFKDKEYLKLGYCTYFESFKIAPFINEKVNSDNFRLGINIVTLDDSEIKCLIKDLENEIEKQFLKYEEPKINEPIFKFIRIEKVQYKGKEYQLMSRFNSHHENLNRLLSSLKTAKKANEEKYEYKIYFKKGITYRDDSILRFINYLKKGKTHFESISLRYKGIISVEEINETLQKLETMHCVKLYGNTVEITEIGKNIV